MQKPHPWIIRLERDGQVASTRQKRDVSSRGVVEGKVGDACFRVVWIYALIKNNEVVAVEMDGMSDWNVFLVVLEILGGDDEVNIPVTKVFRYYSVLWIKSGVIEVQNRWV